MSVPKEEKRRQVIAALKEWEVLQVDPTYEQAVCQLANYLSISYPENNYSCAFGEYAICAEGYGILTKDEMESCRRLIKAKRFGSRKPKLWVRSFASTNFYGREYVTVTLPDLVLWELAGVTAEEAQEIRREVAQLLDMELKVVAK